MNLLTKELEKKFEEYPLYSQDGKMGDAKVIAKFYFPVVSTLQQKCIWLITEGDIIRDEYGNIEDVEMFGFVNLNGMDYAELGYVSLNELQSISLPNGLKIEQDLDFPENITLREACKLEFNEVPELFKAKMINYSIYQLNDKESNRFLRFEPIERLKNGIDDIKAENYENVYEGKYADIDMQDNEKVVSAVENIFMKFNSDELMPSDFKGHSLSVSDIVVFENEGFSKAYYIDKIGIKEIPSFPEQLKEERILNLAKRIMRDRVPKDIDPMAYDLTKVVVLGYVQNLHSVEGCKEILRELTDCIETKKNEMETARYEGNYSKESECETKELIAEYQSLVDDITTHINELKELEKDKDEPDICD